MKCGRLLDTGQPCDANAHRAYVVKVQHPPLEPDGKTHDAVLPLCDQHDWPDIPSARSTGE